MFKNIIIAILVVVILNLLVQNKENIDILINDMATAKQKIDRATIYLEDVINENFPPKEFEVKEFKVDIDIPSLQIEKEPMIREETFFNEDK